MTLAPARPPIHVSPMRMLQILLPLFVWSVALPLAAQTPAATQVLTKAKAQAAEQHKSIFLMFDASW